jgi:Uma2 family endonuclease
MESLQSLHRMPDKYQGSNIFTEKDASEHGLYVSETEYWEKYYHHPDFSYEWNNGYLEEKPMTDYRGSRAYQWFLILLHQFLDRFPIAKMIGLEFGFRLALPRKTSIRKPDLAVVLNSNPILLGDTEFSYKGTFDLCIESLSYSGPKEIKRDKVEKKKEYEGIGVREYYILDARRIETAFYRLNAKGKYQKITPSDRDIIQSEVLPGFRFRISDLYRQPSLEEMTDDDLYNSFVLPFHQKIKQRAEQAEQRAEQAEMKAARLEAKLRELGISLD